MFKKGFYAAVVAGLMLAGVAQAGGDSTSSVPPTHNGMESGGGSSPVEGSVLKGGVWCQEQGHEMYSSAYCNGYPAAPNCPAGSSELRLGTEKNTYGQRHSFLCLKN